MSFRTRLVAVCAALVLLLAAFMLGVFFSPERAAQRTAGAPLIGLPASSRIVLVEIFSRALDKTPLLSLKRSGPNQWEAEGGGITYPGSANRISALLDGFREMRRGNLVTRDPAKRPELGLGDDAAHMVLLHVEGGPVAALLVGKKAASGDEEYVMVRGESAAYLTRSSVGILLDQDSAYWYDLRVLPEDIQGSTILTVTVSGSSVKEAYTLERGQGGQGEWRIKGRPEPVNPVAASAMADRLAQLSGSDFAKAPAAASDRPAGGFLQVTITAINGDRYVLRVSPDAEPDRLLLSTGWSPWTYTLDSLTLSRTVLPLSDLLAQQ